MAHNDSPSSLPDPWVERIFAKLSLVYGRDFLSRWEGQNLASVKADWSHELRGFQQAPNAIRHALETLDCAKAPTVLQFRDACLKAPQYAPPALPAPKANPEVVAKVLGAMAKPSARSTLDWAHSLKACEASGGPLTRAQRDMWRAAIEPRMAA